MITDEHLLKFSQGYRNLHDGELIKLMAEELLRYRAAWPKVREALEWYSTEIHFQYRKDGFELRELAEVMPGVVWDVKNPTTEQAPKPFGTKALQALLILDGLIAEEKK